MVRLRKKLKVEGKGQRLDVGIEYELVFEFGLGLRLTGALNFLKYV